MPAETNRIERVFTAASECPPTEWPHVVRELAGGDDELAREVLELLDAAERAPAFLDDELIGARCGDYRIEARIGSGGMGRVYRAVRDRGEVRVRCALKVLRIELACLTTERWFAAEQRSLLDLDHPSIVRLQDVGHTPDGRPFLVTELVDGRPIDAYCREARLGPRAIAELLALVCDAVQHAHQRLVIHCDLKPDNVLITANGMPRLLDFGIARALAGATETADSPAGRTARYASPEQGRGEPLTVGTDVFSLGVLLGELLGERIDRELRAIVARATRPSVGDRYASVADLAADLRAWVAGLPVTACSASPLYRTRKLVRRHRVAAGALALAAIASALGVYGLARARDAARRDAGFGWRAHAEAAMVTRFLESLLVQCASGSDLELQLDAASAVVAERYASAPEAEGRIRAALGSLYLHLEAVEKAHAHLHRAVELATTRHGFGRTDVERFRGLLAKAARDRG